MAHILGRTPFGGTKISSSLVFDEFVPPSAWTEDSTNHYLLVDLPGFKKQELKLQVDNQTHIVVSGERQVRENNYKRFEKKFELPKNADIESITGKLDGEILYITVAKKEQKQEHEHEEIKHGSIHGGKMDMFDPVPSPVSDNDDDDDKNSDPSESEDENDIKNGVERRKDRRGIDEDWGKEADLFLRLAIEKLRKNKGIVVTAIFAFSLGVLVTHKFQSNGQ